MNIRVCFALSCLSSVCVATATTVPITNPGLLTNTSVVQWNAYNPDYTTGTVGFFPFGANGVTIDSVNNFTGVPDSGVLEVRTEGASWLGEMTPGDGVLYFHNDFATTSSVFHLHFSSPIQGFILQSQSNAFGAYNVAMGVWDAPYPTANALTGGTTTGTNSASMSATQGWLGGLSNTNEISDVYIAVSMADGSDTVGAGFGPLYVQSVPEPTTMLVLGGALLPLLRRREK